MLTKMDGMSSTPTNELASRIHSAAIHLLRRVRRSDLELGLTPARLSALSILVFGGPHTLGDLAGEEQVRPATMSRLVRDLVARGLVTRRVRETDRRVIDLAATPAGVQLLRAGQALRVGQIERGLTRLSPAQRRTLTEAVALLADLDLSVSKSR